jgi:hypothetical protein
LIQKVAPHERFAPHVFQLSSRELTSTISAIAEN